MNDEKKLISCILSSMLCTSIGILPVKAEQTPYFTHQNVVGSQTCYGDDTAEKRLMKFECYSGNEN